MGELIPTEFAVLENGTDGTESCDQQSEYDSTSDEEDQQLAEDHEKESDVEPRRGGGGYSLIRS